LQREFVPALDLAAFRNRDCRNAGRLDFYLKVVPARARLRASIDRLIIL